MHSYATYSPEDNKIRLYVGRVPREDYERLRAAGFVSTPKQNCDFVATWTPAREDLAREFFPDDEDIGDEDYSPLERSADRAERFEDYRGKRVDEATGAADQFAAGPQAFGHQNRARAERQAARHDRRRTFAVSQWSKAEYWTERTRGVIAHALYKSSASVRRGRILTLEAEQRRMVGRTDEYGQRWAAHYELRLGYERAMLAEEGGSASEADMEPGGWIGANQIHAVNRSPVTKRVVSVKLMAPPRWGNGPVALRSFNIERMPEGAYRAPTDEEREAFKAATSERKAKEKASKPKEPALINPTDEDAAKLQSLWNERTKTAHEKRKAYGPCPVSEVRRMTQAEYSARSKGSYGSCETSDISERLQVRTNYVTRSEGGRVTVFKVRTCHGENYGARRIIVLTDKPQKPIPWADVDRGQPLSPAGRTGRDPE